MDIFKKITGSQKTASGSRRHHDNLRLSGHLLVSEGPEQFKQHCAISGLVSALILGQPFETMPSCMA
jgi:hypothetical protein